MSEFINQIFRIFMQAREMKVDARAAYFETPVKKVAEENAAELTDVGSGSSRRCSPSSELQSLLKRIQRIHEFRHSPVMKCIEKMKLSLKVRNELRSLFDGFEDDESDWIIKLEAECTEIGKFSTFVRKYISLEFRVQLQYSFCVFLVLNYMKELSLDAETAFVDVFKLKVEDTFCSSCTDLSVLMLKKENLDFLKKVFESGTNISLDDSDCDPEFELKNYNDVDSSVETFSDDEMSKNKTVGKVKINKEEELHLSNPFVSDEDCDDDDVYRFSEKLDCNPFVNTGDVVDYQRWKINSNANTSAGQKMSSVKEKSKIQLSKCEHCEGQFRSKYNLKLHMVQVHRIFFSDVTVYDCPESSCKFLTGSRICYNRHAATHSRKPKIIVNTSKIKCRYCSMVLSNKSSLKRHERRKHKDN